MRRKENRVLLHLVFSSNFPAWKVIRETIAMHTVESIEQFFSSVLFLFSAQEKTNRNTNKQRTTECKLRLTESLRNIGYLWIYIHCYTTKCGKEQFGLCSSSWFHRAEGIALFVKETTARSEQHLYCTRIRGSQNDKKKFISRDMYRFKKRRIRRRSMKTRRGVIATRTQIH